ncbi:MAG: excinuclease ABC subunit UvrB [Patescibacteria group bacterium]
MKFQLRSTFTPSGDQPAAIATLATNMAAGVKHQTLLGVTGSGKTYTVANVIEKIQKPCLVISHNKTLAAQLYQEFKEFFPDNAVRYFVSYYDYYQPEAYIPRTDTYIEKDAKINEVIDGLRHASTASLLTRRDVIIVASVSCIYGVGSPEEYQKVSVPLRVGTRMSRQVLLAQLVALQYSRNPVDPRQGHFRTRENTVEIHLPSGEQAIMVVIEHGRIASLTQTWKLGFQAGNRVSTLRSLRIFPAKHFVTPQDKLDIALANIRQELRDRLATLKSEGNVLEAARLKQRTEFDLETLQTMGYVNGIENYSRHLDFREPGTPPHTLLDYFRYAHGDDFLTVIDESHATIPQIRGMERGDRSRKNTLVQYGFRLPSAMDNRPLTFAEFNQKINRVIYASATPAAYEIDKSRAQDPTAYNLPPTASFITEQLIRPTGILDPKIEIRPTKNQVQDIIAEIKIRSAKNERSLVLALTKRLAEDIAEYLAEAGVKAQYLHADVKTLERPDILNKLRLGEHDVIVGINLLREGLDLPEVSFIAILDADKEGFLRNETTLLQIIGRAARHTDGKVILYADAMTGSMRAAIRETDRRRNIQEQHNHEHGITPKKIEKAIRDSLREEKKDDTELLPEGPAKEIIKELEREMKKAARAMDFERAAILRDRIKRYNSKDTTHPVADKEDGE